MKLLFILLLPLVTLGQEFNGTNIFDFSRKGRLEEVIELVEQNPSIVNLINDQNHSPLIISSYYQHKDLVEYFISKKANINYQSDNGTALSAAVVKHNLEIAQMLLLNNANPDIPDINGVTPLIHAIIFRDKSMINLLISHKADISKPDHEGKTPFEYALTTGNQEIINLFKN